MKRIDTFLIVAAVAALLFVVINPSRTTLVSLQAVPIADSKTSTDANDPLGKAKAKSAQAVNDRLETIKNLRDRLNQAKYLSAPHRTAIEAELSVVSTGLRETNGEVQAATTYAAAVQSAKRIVSDYWVYAFELPKVQLLIAIDDVTAVCDRLDQIVGQLRLSLDALQASGRNVSKERTKVDEIRKEVDSLRVNAKSHTDAVSALDAKGYPANRSVLQSARSFLGQAHTTINSIRDEVKPMNESL